MPIINPLTTLWKIDFLIRLPSNAFKEVTLFMASRKTDQIVEIFPSQSAQKTCLELGIPIKSLKARLIKVKLKTGETEVLITSLTDRELCPESIFGALYALRWGIEEEFKTLKCSIEIEAFSGKSVLSVRQDFHSGVLLSNIQALLTLAKSVREKIKENTVNRKYEYKENRTQALLYIRDFIMELFTHGKTIKALQELKNLIVDNIIPIRPGRSFKRNINSLSKPKHPHNRKANA